MNIDIKKVNLIRKPLLNTVFVLICSVLFSITILSGVMFYKYVGNPGHIPSVFGYNAVTVLSGSMKPVLKPGDVILSKSYGFSDLKEGSIVTFETNDGILITHRIIEKVDRDSKVYFRTKGDANDVMDKELIKADQVVGKYSFRIPFIGYIGKFATTQKGLITFTTLGLFLIMFNKLKSILLNIFHRRAYKSEKIKINGGIVK